MTKNKIPLKTGLSFAQNVTIMLQLKFLTELQNPSKIRHWNKMTKNEIPLKTGLSFAQNATIMLQLKLLILAGRNTEVLFKYAGEI